MNTYKVKIKGIDGYNSRIYVSRTGGIIDHKSLIDEQRWNIVTKQAIPKLLELNEKQNMLMILSFFLTAVQKEIISEFNGHSKFPVLSVVGGVATGKSTITILTNRLLGGEDILNASGTSVYVINRKLAETNAFPVVLDDYDNRYNSLLKLTYESGQICKGNSQGQTIEYNLKAPVCILSERLTNDEALLNRSIVVKLSSDWLNENHKRTFEIVKELNAVDLKYFLDGYLKMLLVLNKEKNLESIYRSAENRVLEFSKGNKHITDRQILALTVLVYGMNMLKEVIRASAMGYKITEDDYKMVFEQYLRNTEG